MNRGSRSSGVHRNGDGRDDNHGDGRYSDARTSCGLRCSGSCCNCAHRSGHPMARLSVPHTERLNFKLAAICYIGSWVARLGHWERVNIAEGGCSRPIRLVNEVGASSSSSLADAGAWALPGGYQRAPH